MKKSKKDNKINAQEILNDVNKVLYNINSLDFLNIDKNNIDKISNKIINNVKDLEKKYKQYLPKKDLDSEK